jgi:hypothetical protein
VSTHEDFSRKEGPSTGSDRGFGVVFTVVFLAIGLLPLLSGNPLHVWSITVSLLILLITLVRPVLLAPFNRIWGLLGLALSRIVNPIVLGIIFFGVITPTGLVMRLFGKDIIRLRFESESESYWISRHPPGPSPESMKNQF